MNTNPILAFTNNAWIMFQETEKKLEPAMVVLPISCVRDVDFGLYMFLEASGTQWNQYYGLNRPRNWFSVLDFSWKISSLLRDFWRSLDLSRIRFAFYTYVWMIRSKNLVKKIHELMNQYLIFMALVFQIFFMLFGFNHIQSPLILS